MATVRFVFSFIILSLFQYIRFVVKNKEHHLTFINYNAILFMVVNDKLQLDKNLLISLILTSHYVVKNLDDVKRSHE